MANESPKGVDPQIYRGGAARETQEPRGPLRGGLGESVDQRSRSELACAVTAVPWGGEFAVLRYVVLTEGAINDALEALPRTHPSKGKA